MSVKENFLEYSCNKDRLLLKFIGIEVHFSPVYWKIFIAKGMIVDWLHFRGHESLFVRIEEVF